MSVGSIMLAAILTVPVPAAPYPVPGEPGYSVAKAFVAIVRRDDEVNVRAISDAFGLSKFDRGFFWHGPFGEPSTGRSYTYYDPPNSRLGITKIVVEWNNSAVVHAGGKSGASRSLVVHLRPDACPSEAEMVAATGVPMNKDVFPSTDAGPPYSVQ